MSRIIGSLFHESPLMFWPIVALALFFGVFVAIVTRLTLQGSRHYEAQSRAPLDDERPVGRLS